jgi:hypothetical protein
MEGIYSEDVSTLYLVTSIYIKKKEIKERYYSLSILIIYIGIREYFHLEILMPVRLHRGFFFQRLNQMSYDSKA